MNNKLPKEQETFNEETISALNEVDEMRKHPEQYPSYTSVDTMFDTLLKEARYTRFYIFLFIFNYF